jgi:O-antigen ligase
MNWLGKSITALGLIGVAFVVAVACVAFWPLALILPAGAAFTFWAFISPAPALLLTLFFIPFERMAVLFPPEAQGQVTLLSSLTVPKLMLVALIGVAAFRMLVARDDRPVRRFFEMPLPALTVLFAVMTFASLLNATDPGLFFGYQSRVINGIVFFFVINNLVTTKSRLYNAMRVLCFSYFFIGLSGVYETVTQEHILTTMGFPMKDVPYMLQEDKFRIAGPSGDPDFFAISIVLGFMATLTTWRLVRGWLLKSILVGILLMHVFVILATGSRGAALSLLLAVGVFWLWVEMRHKFLIAFAASLAVGAVAAYYTLEVSSLTAERYTGEAGQLSLQYRLGWTMMCWEMVKEHPLVGVGTAQFMADYHNYVSPLVPREPLVAQNTYAQMAAENGLPALFVYLVIYGLAGYYLAVAARRARDPVIRYVSLCLLGTLAAFVFFAGTLNTVSSEINWMVLALTCTVWRIAQQDQEGATG